jgi:hypothetical protein
MAGNSRRAVAYTKADAAAKAILAAGQSWSHEKGVYLFARDNALRLPGLVLAGVVSESRREESVRLLMDALAVASAVEYAMGLGASGSTGETVKKALDAATEAREAVQDHLDAMQI